MKTLICLISLALASSLCFANDYELIGKWKLDGPRTIAKISEEQKLSTERLHSISKAFEREQEVEFSETHLTSNSKIPTNPDEMKTFSTRYEILGMDENTTVFKSENSVSGKESITQVHFETEDRFWILVEGTSWRQYFTRELQ